MFYWITFQYETPRSLLSIPLARVDHYHRYFNNTLFIILAICPISSFLPKEVGFWPYTFLVDFDLSQVTFDRTNKKAIQISIRDYSTIVKMIYCRGPPPGVRKKKKQVEATKSIGFTSTDGLHKGKVSESHAAKMLL